MSAEVGVVDCCDSSCMFAEKRTGMRTNGGCRCFRESMEHGEYRRLSLWVRRQKQLQKQAIADAEARGAARERAACVARARWLAASRRKAAGDSGSNRSVSALGAAGALEAFAGHIERGDHVAAPKPEGEVGR